MPFVGALFVAGRLSPRVEHLPRRELRRGAGADRERGVDRDPQVLAAPAAAGRAATRSRCRRATASTAFALATVAERHYGWKAGLPAYALAAGIGLSRIESNKHYLSDVIAGATIGTIVGRTVTRVDGGRASRRTLAVTPATDAHGAGVGLGFSASW